MQGNSELHQSLLLPMVIREVSGVATGAHYLF
jgi:hypothetical protein